MTSSMLAGERRWASARRSGMTVLGKVAVPKPLNLPSQRLENHGLDPNVEIVPKGTLSWGSQASSVPNAWGSSALSPNADGSTSSPSQLSGRPSSASGTRPSTAGSDRTQDPTPNAWGQSSRPSSASGVLTSNQTALTSLRPRSAETRPGSAQLSRFAEPSSDSSVAWGPSGVSNKLGASSSKNDGFSLSSGDFPTLGSEKDNSGKNTDSQEHGYNSRPSSSGAASGKERNITSSVGNVNIETANTWTRDGSQQAEDGVQPTAEKWQGDMPPCANPNRLPQYFDAWHGPPINPPPGVWYRGPPGGPPYRSPLPPSGFPIEPFPFYRPQMPPNSSQPVPPGAGPRGHHPKNGEVCRPHVPDAYMHPRMPINPGFYPGPVAYEGYYGPPMGYCNPNEREMPFMGMAAGPPVYKRHPAENALDPHARAPAHGSRAKPLTPEQIDGGHSDDTRGPYKVLLKQSNDWDEKRAEEEWEHGVPSYVPHIEKRDQPRTSLQKNEWGLEARRDEEYSLRKTCSEDSRSRNFDHRGTCSSGSAKLPESRGNVNAVDNLGNKLENVSSSFPQPTQVLSATPKDPSLIQKIHGLNAKARISDGRSDAATLPCREDQYDKSHVDAMVTYPAASSGTATLRRPSHGAQSRLDHRSKRFNNQDADGWRKKPFAAESSVEVSVTNSESGSNVLVRDCHRILEESGKSEEYNPEGKDEDESLTPGFDASDSVAQRAKMREIAKQRAEQLQKEEEERTREQKAKALAKLEELNRRTHITDVSSQKLEKAPPGGPVQQEEEVSRKCAESYTGSSKSETSNSALVRNQNDQIKGTNTIMVGENPVLFDGTLLEMPDNLHPKSDVTNCEAASQVSEGNVSKHKRLDSKQRQSINLGKNVIEKSVPVTQTEAPKYHTDLAVANDALPSENIAIEVGSSCESSLLTNSNVVTESSTHHRRKYNRGSKNRHKVDDASPVTAVSSAVSKETNAIKVSTEKLESDTNLLQSKTVAKHAIQDSEQHSSLHSEETVGKGSNQWKFQQSRRMPRSLQASNRMGEKLHRCDAVTWAPVRSQNKTEVMDKPGDKTEPEAAIANAKIDSIVQNNMKTKRAEMERYIPKPVAKELAQQGSTQQPVISQNAESTQHGDSTIVDIGPNAESKNGDSKQNKPSKARGSWRQRGYVESAPNLGFQEGFSSSLEAGKGIQKPIEQGQSLKSDISTLQEQTKSSSDLNSTDGWNTNDNSDAAASVTSAVVKGQGVTDRGKRPSVKGHRSMGNNFDLDHGNANSGLTDDMYSESPAPEMSQMDKSNALKENHFGGERTSQWQPKSQVYSVHNRRSRPSDEQIDAAPKSHKGSGENMLHTHVDQSSTEPMNVEAAQNMVHHEFKRERKAASFRGRPRSPNLSTVTTGETESVHTKHDQHFSSGFRKNGNHANRSGRGHESRGDVSSGGQDNRQHNASFNRERPRQNSHFEYQPIGQYSNNKSNNLEVSTEGSHNTGSKYRERNQDHSRRGGGNIYGRRSGTVQGDARYD